MGKKNFFLILISLILLLSLGFVHSADTGFKSPTSTGEDYNQWTNPSNAFSSDNNWAFEGTSTEKQDYYDFSFSVPVGATIDGIEISVEGGTEAGNADLIIELSWDGGSSYTSEGKTNIFPAEFPDVFRTYGGSTDTWGRTWSDTEFSNANFRARIEMQDNTNIYIDHIQVKVYYTEGGDSNPPTFNQSQVNETHVNFPAEFGIYVDDDTALETNGYYIFSTNNSGTWTNDSAINFTATPSWANVTKNLNETNNQVVGYRWYLYDNAGNLNDTGEFLLTTTIDSFTKDISESFNLNENNINQNSLERNLQNSLSLNDNILRNSNLNRDSLLSLIYGEFIQRQLNILKNNQDSFTINNLINLIYGQTRNQQDSFTINDNINRLLNLFRNEQDTINLNENIEKQRNIPIEIIQSFAINENLNRVLNIIKSLTNQINFNSFLSKMQSTTKDFQDSFTINLNTDYGNGVGRDVFDSFTIADSISRNLNINKLFTDSFSLTDSSTSTLNFFRNLQNSFAITDSTQGTRSLVKSITDSFVINNFINRQLTINRLFSDIINFIGNLFGLDTEDGGGDGGGGGGGGTSPGEDEEPEKFLGIVEVEYWMPYVYGGVIILLIILIFILMRNKND